MVIWRNSVPAPTLDGTTFHKAAYCLRPGTLIAFSVSSKQSCSYLPHNFRIYFLGDVVRLNLVTVCGGQTEPCSQDWVLRQIAVICALLHMSCT